MINPRLCFVNIVNKAIESFFIYIIMLTALETDNIEVFRKGTLWQF